MKKRKHLKDYPRYEQNPFLEGLKLKKGTKAVSISRAHAMVTEHGEVVDNTARMVVRAPMDKSHFGKLFFENIPLEKLEGVACILLLYLLNKVYYNHTKVHFDPKEWLDEDKTDTPNYSVKTIYRAIKNLLDNDMIARVGGGFYFINPAVGFKGNRLELLK